MKKRNVLIGMAATVLLSTTLVGCSNGSDKSSSSNNTRTVKTTKKQAKYYFKNNKLVMSDISITITKTKVIPVGEIGNEYGEKPVIAFWFTTTNKSNKEINPNTAWIAAFTAVQDNNKNQVNELDIGNLPDDRFLDTQSENIKKNGTAESAIAYDLDDTTTPVKLTATKGIGGSKLGTMTYKLK
ncbi:DUF5067 domain-containing protein [Companilactobacillus ginsenosidimutans]|uniref:DUF5067 domain-containing protein n=1 Tax=Companilactobacillus ginsenosidimutans TaxID=1007676 RepID=A0A0H4QJH1_9LACO|nr:DUF5067 domain-containing protein [Companilactobacillus ginsenosidimutans]AKP66823.1 hypothetical protein ABM34_04070 [Companilactobacillus ginsenosidimutans]